MPRSELSAVGTQIHARTHYERLMIRVIFLLRAEPHVDASALVVVV